MAEATKWYVLRGEAALGPFDLAELKRMAAAGSVSREDLVCPEGGTAWGPATTVPGLFPSPPPLPPRPGGNGTFVPCAKCAKAVSDEAVACPHCGERQPKQDQLDGNCDGGKCEQCGTFNLLGLPCHFPEHPNFTCRGCGRPLTEAYPTAHTVSKMERVHRHWLEVRGFWGWVAAVACFAVQQFAVPFQGGWVVGVFCGAVGYSLASYATKRLWRARAEARDGRIREHVRACPYAWDSLDSYTEETLRNRSPRDWQQNGTFVYVPRKVTETVRGEGTAARPVAAPSQWKAWAVAAVVLVGGAYLFRSEFSQYELGRKAGVQHVRETNMKGPFIRAGMNVAKMLDLIPINPDASADWNAGFRAGFKEELARMYPELKGR